MNPRDILLRPGTGDDLPAMARVTTEAINVDTPDVFTPTENLSSLHERRLYPGFWSHVATSEDEVVGFAAGYPGDWRGPQYDLPEETNSNYLWLLMVHNHHWGKQIGSRLLELVAQETAEAGLRSVNLYTRAENTRAQQLYERHGYVRLDDPVISVRQGPMFRYVLDLAAGHRSPR